MNKNEQERTQQILEGGILKPHTSPKDNRWNSQLCRGPAVSMSFLTPSPRTVFFTDVITNTSTKKKLMLLEGNYDITKEW